MIVPPPLVELAAAELRLVARTGHTPGRFATLWGEFRRSGDSAIACDGMVEVNTSIAPAAVLRPIAEAPAATAAPSRRRRRSNSARAERRRRIKQHNRQLAKRAARNNGGSA
jgi:hypothetical protein